MLRRIGVYFKMIEAAHTVFALPFALVGMFLASFAGGLAYALPCPRIIFFILLAMVGARSAAMGFNRLADARLDAMNPRTKDRAIPSGKVSRGQACALVAFSSLLLVFAAWKLNPLAFKLSPALLLFLFFYSYTKRFTWVSHFFLGACLGAAPLAAWIAVAGEADARILSVCLAVMFWTAGFDVLYALQDIEFDRKTGLHSIPRFLGVEKSLWAARIFHLAMAMLLLLSYYLFGLGWLYLVGLFFCFAVLAYEHSIISKDDLSRLDMAFFNLNGVVSVAYCLFTYLDLTM
ncbi:MAG: putative 4-hydroxybenzoate polyprenyltransferase [Syntrophorhabdaceae bacterium]|nr:putative 4-hydroxybenzoate polyprenyltransferase [Syntrophorhabdaceae bacterium]